MLSGYVMRNLSTHLVVAALAATSFCAAASDADGDTPVSPILTLKASGNGPVTVSDGRGNVSEVIDQRKLWLNQPSARVLERAEKVREQREEFSEQKREKREEKAKRQQDAAAKEAEKAAKEAEAKAKVTREAAYKSYEEALKLPPRDRRTGRYRPEPKKPEGYSADWNSSDS